MRNKGRKSKRLARAILRVKHLRAQWHILYKEQQQ